MLPLIFLLACSSPPTITATPEPNGISVVANSPIRQAELVDARGLPVLRTRPPAPTDAVTLAGHLDAGTYTVRVDIDGAWLTSVVTVPERPPLEVELQPVAGGDWIAAGDQIIPVVEGATAEVLLRLTGGPGMPASVQVDGETVPLGVEGERVVRTITVGSAPRTVVVGERTFTLTPKPVSLESLRAGLTVVSDVFPAESTGDPDLGRPVGRVALPSPTWERLIRAVGLGGRRRDDVAPWAFWGITLGNMGSDPVDVQVSLEVREGDAVAPDFRPRLRSGDGGTGTVSALVRVPPGGATAALPVFVDTANVRSGEYTAVLRVAPMGGGATIHELERTLYVGRGDIFASVGFAASLVAAFAGVVLIVRRLRAWLSAATSDLMTIALFGSSLFVVGTASDVLAMGVGVVFGPLSTLFTGLLSDLGRYALLGTLITLVPRTGTLALAVLTGTFLRGFTTGSWSPTDLLYLGVSVGYTELFAWLAPPKPRLRRRNR